MDDSTAPSPHCDARPLSRADLLRNQDRLRAAAQALLSCASVDLTFPADPAAQAEPKILAEDGELLLPLMRGGRYLGLLAARGVDPAVLALSGQSLCNLAGVLLDNLALAEGARRDALTGLLTGQALLDAATRAVERFEACLHPGGASCLEPAGDGVLGTAGGRFALAVLDLDRFRRLGRRFGFCLAEDILARIGHMMAGQVAVPSLACRLGQDTFAVLTPDASPARALDAAEDLRLAVAGLDLTDPLSGRRLRISCSAGLAVYPHDLKGAQLALPAPERARLVLEKARLAAELAKARTRAGGAETALAFGQALNRGGLVLETLPMGRAVFNLGRLTDAREGLRFSVLAGQPGASHDPFKAEMVLTEVHEDVSVAEAVYLADPSAPPAPGDTVALLDDHDAPAPWLRPDAAAAQTPQDELLTYQDFQASWPALSDGCAGCAGCALVQLRLSGASFGLENGASSAHALRQVAGLVREVLPRRLDDAKLLLGRLGKAGLSLFVAGADTEKLREALVDLAGKVGGRLQLDLAAGVATHPYLGFGRADLPENARKALEHALLLPSPKVAVFDSISLTISADRHFAQGDVYAAVEEYKLALLADEHNLLAANSLGICHARLGRNAQALRLFDQVLDADPNDLMARYNHGTVSQKLGNVERAREDFSTCLRLAPDHLYSLVRLGRLEEDAGDMDAARARYEAACGLPGGEEAALGHLARLDVLQNRPDDARERLHRTLAVNPGDALSLLLLAQLYLDSCQDPELAEALARQATALAPGNGRAWDLLAVTLEAGGKTKDAAQARAKAESVGYKNQ